MQALNDALIFVDFDDTVTFKHTFATKCISNLKDALAAYDEGKKFSAPQDINAFPQVKQNLVAPIRAIITFHNNPSFVAGVMAGIWGKELTLVSTTQSTHPVVCCDAYAVEGEPELFYITYLPDALQKEFDYKVFLLNNNKNHQIQFTLDVLEKNQQYKAGQPIHFYDDSERNVTQAQKLELNITCYRVEKENVCFKARALPPAEQPIDNISLFERQFSEWTLPSDTPKRLEPSASASSAAGQNPDSFFYTVISSARSPSPGQDDLRLNANELTHSFEKSELDRTNIGGLPVLQG